jgi:hypothetical protein
MRAATRYVTAAQTFLLFGIAAFIPDTATMPKVTALVAQRANNGIDADH